MLLCHQITGEHLEEVLDFGFSGLRRCVGRFVSDTLQVSQSLECQEPDRSPCHRHDIPEDLNPQLKDCLTVNNFKFQL
jgi:hypothetical protein